MAIPRLEPSDSPYVTEITVNVNLRPYFEIWFQRMRDPEELPADFALRMLKRAALYDYVKIEADAVVVAIEIDKDTAITDAEITKETALSDLQADIDLMDIEVG